MDAKESERVERLRVVTASEILAEPSRTGWLVERRHPSLRTRLARTTPPARPQRARVAGPGFVEVGGGALLGALGAGGSVVELRRRDGMTLVVRLSGAEPLDVVALSAAFVGRRR
ncbi:MAG: hypothetical protein ACREI9_15635 [Nitrospiraceae bacterium]